MIGGLYKRVWDTSAGKRTAIYIIRGMKALSLRTGHWQHLRWWDSQPGEWVRVGDLQIGSSPPPSL